MMQIEFPSPKSEEVVFWVGVSGGTEHFIPRSENDVASKIN